jgi:hypothetical protein
MKADGSLPADTKQRSSKYLNNLIEQDHRGVKQRIAVLGFKQFRRAAITIAGIEPLHRIRKGQFGLRRLGVEAELRLPFGVQCSRHKGDRSRQRHACSCCRFAPVPDKLLRWVGKPDRIEMGVANHVKYAPNLSPRRRSARRL